MKTYCVLKVGFFVFFLIYWWEIRQNFWYTFLLNACTPWNDWYQFPLSYMWILLFLNKQKLSVFKIVFDVYPIWWLHKVGPNNPKFVPVHFAAILLVLELTSTAHTYLPVLNSRYGLVWEYGEWQEVFLTSWRPRHQSKQWIVPFGYPPKISKGLNLIPHCGPPNLINF